MRELINKFVRFCIPTYSIREERMGGEDYWMIYRDTLFGSDFFERWNSFESAHIRWNELEKSK